MSYFGLGSAAYHVKWDFGLFQRENLVLISPSSHVDLFYTHSQSFMHCRTIVVTIIKCIISVTLKGSHHSVVTFREV